MELTIEQLSQVVGGYSYSDADLGRCGPGSGMKFLGDVRTCACAKHDTAVRTALEHGSSRFMAQVKALPLLPAAVGSYVRARLH
jgi:hypothetical protein